MNTRLFAAHPSLEAPLASRVDAPPSATIRPLSVLVLGLVLTSVSPSLAQPVVKDATRSVYAKVADPVRLAFAPDGTLYVGRDNSGSGGGAADAVKIHRIAPGGAPVSEFVKAAIADPDAVVYDAAGVISGIAGAVIVGGVTADGSTEGRLSRIAPDGAATTLFGPSSAIVNPGDFVFDATGRLLFTDVDGGKVWVMTNATPQTLASG